MNTLKGLFFFAIGVVAIAILAKWTLHAGVALTIETFFG